MGHAYRSVSWNPQKRRYDIVLASSVAVSLVIVAGGTAILHPQATIETVLIRALGVTAFLLLHVILSIGPLCRLDRRFLPLLYNRRHLGVTMFLVAAAHGGFAVVQFHALGDTSPLVSVLTTSRGWSSVGGFPFQVLGLAALAILFVMAATSHDFWLRTLTAPVWKAIHMGVYVAYALVVLHVALGALQAQRSGWLAGLLCVGAAWVLGLQIVAAGRETTIDRRDLAAGARDPFVEVCPVDAIPEDHAVVACVSGERIAVFRYNGLVSAISNVCQHQNGPLGEGRIVNGCVVCPWHGYEYRPDTGASPPPFTEKVPTFRVTIRNARVFVDPRPLAAGTRVEPARVAAITVPAGRA